MKGSKVLIFFFIPVLILFGVGFVFGPLGTSFFGTKTPSFLEVPKPNVELPAEPLELSVVPDVQRFFRRFAGTFPARRLALRRGAAGARAGRCVCYADTRSWGCSAVR